MELLAIINFIGLIYLLIVVHNLKSNLQTSTKLVPSQKKKDIQDAVPVYRENIQINEQNPDILQKFFTWFARDWPLKVGALFILLGFVWLVTYAFMNNWIGPVGRIVFGIVVGSAVLIWGSARIKFNVYQGEILTALGAGIVLVSIFSAQYVYNKMFPPAAALCLVSLITLTVAFISYRNNTIRLAILGFIIGAIAPMLTASDTPGVLGLFSYLFCLTVATVWLVRITGWRALLIISMFAIWVYSIPWFNTYISPTNLVYMRFFAVTFSIMFYLLSLSAFAYDRTTKPEDAIVGGLIGLYSLHWIMTIVPPEYRSMLCVVFAVGFMVGSFVIFRTQKIEYPVYLYTGVSIVFLIAATLIQFKGNVLPIVLAVEALTLIIFADTMYGPRMVKWMAFLFVLPILYSLPYLFNFSSEKEHGTLIFINLMLYAGGVYLMRYTKQTDESIGTLAKVLTVAGGIYSLLYVWVAMPYYVGYEDRFRYDYDTYRNMYGSSPIPVGGGTNTSLLFMARSITLTIYAVVGIGMYVYGMREKKSLTKTFGFWLTCFVIGRLLLVEVWDMTLAARIITFFMIGVIFMASVFIRKKSHEI